MQITDETLSAVREALKAQFRKTVEGSSGEPFEATKVTMPQDLVWNAYARAAIAAALPLIRGAVVEECAKVADASKDAAMLHRARATAYGHDDIAVSSGREAIGAAKIADAIRALSPREAGE